MNAHTAVEEAPMIDALPGENRRPFSALQRRAREAVPAARDYARSHPGMLIAAGLAAFGGVVLALIRGRRSPSRLQIMRGWIDDAASRLPRRRRSLLDRITGRNRGYFA